MSRTPESGGWALRRQRQLIRLTFPTVKAVFRRHVRGLVFLGVLSVIAGFVPTLKSELESGVIEQIDGAIGRRDEGAVETPAPREDGALRSALASRLRRFDRAESTDQRDLPERLAVGFFRGVTLGTAILIYLFIALLVLGIELGTTYVQSAIGKDVFAALRGLGMRKALTTDPADLPSVPNVAGQYAEAVQQGAANVSGTYGYMLEAGQHVFALVTTLALVATKSPAFALAILALVLGQVALSVLQARRLEKSRRLLDAKRNELVARSDDILGKREIILAYEQQERYGKELDVVAGKFAEVARELDVRQELYRRLSSLVTDVGRILVLVVALVVALWLSRDAVTDIGDAYFLISIYVRIFVPASNLLTNYDNIRRSEAVSNTYLAVLASPDPPQPAPEPQHAAAPHPLSIRWEDVSFTYGKPDEPDPRWVLHDVSFTIPGGSTTLLLGPSGCGKSTIARILLGFWLPSKGRVLVDGRDIVTFSRDELHLLMSYVSQGDHIVEDTVRGNLDWGTSTTGLSEEQMLDVLASVGLPKEIKGHSILEHPAKELSIGQQQRLSLARMMLDESWSVAILDEPLAGVDVFTLRDLLPPLKRVLAQPNRTVLLISHRLSFAAFAQHVIVLDEKGNVLEEGAPQDLLAKRATFASLYEATTEEFLLS